MPPYDVYCYPNHKMGISNSHCPYFLLFLVPPIIPYSQVTVPLVLPYIQIPLIYSPSLLIVCATHGCLTVCRYRSIPCREIKNDICCCEILLIGGIFILETNEVKLKQIDIKSCVLHINTMYFFISRQGM